MSKNRIVRHALIVFLLLPLIAFAEAKEIKVYKVIKGDTLWDITKAELNDPFLWPKVWNENPGIVNPDLIYPDQMIKIPLYLIQQEKREEEVRPEPASKPASESQGSEVVPDQCYKEIKGIVLMNGEKIEGRIIILNADRIVIRTKDGKVSCYDFIKEVQNFIKE
jgi:hypothetical protein